MTKTVPDNQRTRRSKEAGQAIVFVVLALGLFLLGSVAFAVDFTNLYLRHEIAQTAADAACTAGVMDMMLIANGGTVTAANMSPADFNCSNTNIASPTTEKVPCWYAAVNGFTSPGLTANTASNLVEATFPDVSACPNGSACPAPGATPISNGFLPAAWAGKPVLKIKVTDRVRTSFLGMVTAAPTADVSAIAVCGLAAGNSPAPITVLAPTGATTLRFGGTSNTTISGGPPRSVQVNSINSGAISGSGGVNLNLGGPSLNGGILAVFGGPTTPIGGWVCTATNCAWLAGATPASDPYLMVPTPAVPTFAGFGPNPPTILRAGGVNGCPDNGGCDEYQPGYYPSGIQIQGTGSNTKTAIFVPGLYYMGDNSNGTSKLDIRGNSCLRPSTATGDGSKGVTFFFKSNQAVEISGTNSGDCAPSGGSEVIASYTASDSICIASGMGSSTLPPGLPSTFTGSVLLGPCNAPDAATLKCAPNCSINFGDPLLSANPFGEQRGILFYQDRTWSTATGSMSAPPRWQGGGNFFISGNMYFHHTTTYANNFTFQANGASGYFSGAIVADTFDVGGNAPLTMYLNPNSGYVSLKASLIK